MNKKSTAAGTAFVLILWQILSSVFSGISAPSAVIAYLPEFLSKENFFYHLFLTILRSSAGFFLAFASALAAAVISARKDWMYRSLSVPVSLLQAAPPLFWLLPVLLLFGTGHAGPAAITFLVVFPLCYFHFAEGIRAIDAKTDYLFLLYAPSFRLRFQKWILPELRPYIQSVTVLGSALALKSSVVGEWFTASDGTGRLINIYYTQLALLDFYTAVFLFLVFSFLYAGLIQLLFSQLSGQKKSADSPAFSFKPILDETKPAPPEAVIAEKISFSWDGSPLLKEASLSIQPGKIAVLTGSTGSGKSTLGLILLGLIRPKSGTAMHPQNRAASFQQPIFLKDSIAENLSLSLRHRKDPCRIEKWNQMISDANLKAFMNQRPDKLSGGWKKIISVYRAILSCPDFLLLDEPFSGVDRKKREMIINMLKKTMDERRMPVLIITHNPSEWKELNPEIYILENGNIKKNGKFTHFA